MLILQLPIYWRSFQQHGAYFKKAKDKEIHNIEEHSIGDEEYIEQVKARLPDGYYPWHYNDVIGWIKLSHHQGLFEYGIFLKQGSRGRAIRRDITCYDPSVSKVYGSLHSTSLEIAEKLIVALDVVCREEPIRRRHVPRGDFERWARFVDWKGIAISSHLPKE